MVTPGTPLGKYHESQARTNEFQFEKKKKNESKVEKYLSLYETRQLKKKSFF